MRTPDSAVTAEWALWGKAPGSREDYQVLETSRGALHDDFAETISRFGTGTDEPLPQVTMSWMCAGETLHLGVAFQEWSGDGDHARRRIARTRYFAVPYGQVTDPPASYAGLHGAFGRIHLPIDDPLEEVPVAALEGADVARALTRATMEATALLLTGRPLCFLGGEDLELEDRVRALDAVAALLPYGFRAGLSASTWTSGSAMHDIRLSFTDFAGRNTNAVYFHEPSGAVHTDLSERYLQLLKTCPDRARLIDRLATFTDPLSFDSVDDRWSALQILDENCYPPVAHRRLGALREVEPAHLEELLTVIADCWEELRPADDLDAYVAELWNLGDEIAQDERHRGQKVIRKRGLLTDRFQLHPDVRLRIVTVAYGNPLTSDAVEQLIRDAHPMTPDLLATLRDMETADHVATVLLAAHDKEHRETILNPLTVEDLIDAADRRPFIADVTRLVPEELYIRGTNDPDTAAVIAKALHDRDYLVDAVRTLPQTGDDQVNCFHTLLTAAYGKRLTEADLKRVVGHPAARTSGALLIAAVFKHDEGAGEPLAHALVQSAAEDIELSKERRDNALALLATASPLDQPRSPRGPVDAVGKGPRPEDRRGSGQRPAHEGLDWRGTGRRIAPTAPVPRGTGSPTRQWLHRLAAVRLDTWLMLLIIGFVLLITLGALYYYTHRLPPAPARQPVPVPAPRQTRQTPTSSPLVPSTKGTPRPSATIRDRTIRTPG